MKTITLEGHKFDVRSLTRGEIKTLRKQGHNLATLTADTADETIDRVLSIILPAKDVVVLDDLPNSATLELFRAVIDLTYGGPAEKNL